MRTALLLHVSDWDAFYLDQELVDEGHHVEITTIADAIIANGVEKFRRVVANNDIPRTGDQLIEFWYVLEHEGWQWDDGWWDFPVRIEKKTWDALTA